MEKKIRVYNTLHKNKEDFVPLKAGEVGIYVCGVTPYNDPHIGNARPFVTWDTIRRFFAKAGYKVRYIQNFTDVDDKIIKAANDNSVTWKDIADKYIAAYFESMDALNVRRADIYPRVSDHIKDIIEMVETLIEKGYAYEFAGDVYFSVEKFEGYGKLSGRKLEDMMAGARVEVNEQKQNPMDFALWKKAKENEPAWESPWGLGRPGWHIECSAMSLKYLGKNFDFHGGGSDLIFPHHENEIAQSQACCDDYNSFARYWLHNGFITINEEKMSKSKNNFFTVRDILEKYEGEVIRFFILQTHYRSPLDFSDERLLDAKASLLRLRNTQGYIEELMNRENSTDSKTDLADNAEKHCADFYEAMADDFNTALAISYLFALSKEINIYYNEVVNEGKPFNKESFEKAKASWDEMKEIIGILEAETAVDSEADEIEELIAKRLEAKKAKNFALADEIRDSLKERGILLEDSQAGTRWRRL